MGDLLVSARQHGILALDLSERTGWAYGCVGDRQPLCGVWVLEGDLGRRLASLENELEDAIVFHRPGLIMVEAPLPPTATSNASTWRQQLALAGVAEMAAYRHELRFREQAASTIRAQILGTCRFPNGDPKKAILLHCQAQGWSVPDHNAGDACVTWQWACRQVATGRAAA